MMFWEWFFGIFTGLVIVFLSSFYCYKTGNKKGIKTGADNLLSLFLKSGYDLKVNAFKIQNRQVKKGGIVFVGDSITQDFPIHDFFPNLLVYNRGIGGDTTVGLLKRLNESIFDLQPSTVVLLIGTNDLALLNATPESIAYNIQTIIQKIKERDSDIKIILQGIYPVNTTIDPFSVSGRNNEDIRKVNQLLKSIEEIIYVDLDFELSDNLGNLKKDLTVEGLHINASGYLVISSKLSSLLSA